MVTTKTDIITDHLIIPDLSTLLNSCCYKLLQLRFHCIVVVIMHKSELYLLSFGRFLFSMKLKKVAH